MVQVGRFGVRAQARARSWRETLSRVVTGGVGGPVEASVGAWWVLIDPSDPRSGGLGGHNHRGGGCIFEVWERVALTRHGCRGHWPGLLDWLVRPRLCTLADIS